MRPPSLFPVDELPEPPSSLVAELEALVGPESVSVDPEARTAASSDMWTKVELWRRKGLTPLPPDVVLYPADTEAVARILRFASERRLPVVPVGARSGVCGGILPTRRETLAIDARRLVRMGRDPDDPLVVTAGAGLLGVELENRLREDGFTLGHYPASIGLSTVGGWVATRSGGQSSSRYGKIEDMIVALECVLGTGDVVCPRRPAQGVDWIELFAGSEGTLGFVTEATLRIWPLPDATVPQAFRFSSVGAGLEALRRIFRKGLRPAVARLYDPLDSLLGSGGDEEVDVPKPPPRRWELLPEEARPLPLRLLWNAVVSRPRALNLLAKLPPACSLVLVHQGESWEAEAEAREAASICEALGGKDLGGGPAQRWLSKRWDVSRQRGLVFELGGWVDTMEIAIGWGGVERAYHAVRRAVAAHAVVTTHFSHAYPDGCSLYFTFLGAAEDVDRGLARYDATWAAALNAARRQGATITHHHGVGLLKGPWLRGELGDQGEAVLTALRAACDPRGILNPGKLP